MSEGMCHKPKTGEDTGVLPYEVVIRRPETRERLNGQMAMTNVSMDTMKRSQTHKEVLQVNAKNLNSTVLNST